jgi:hypothetical protein
MYYGLSMKFFTTILTSIIFIYSFSYCFAEVDYPAMHKNSKYRSKTPSRFVTLKSNKELEADVLKKYYMSSPNSKERISKYSLTGELAYKDPSILRRNRNNKSSTTNRNALIADPAKISKPEKKSFYRYYQRRRYNYDFLYEEEPEEEQSGTLKLTL